MNFDRCFPPKVALGRDARRPRLALNALPGAFGLVVVLLVCAGSVNASVALLMEESYGGFGALAPTGHAAVYLNHVCAETPTKLRPCQVGETGVVISRYHKIDGYDWIAVPILPYLYAVENVSAVPASVNRAQVAALRDAYRRQNLERIAPDRRNGGAPGGEWVQLVGSSYDRTIHGFEVNSTAEQDARFIALFNDKRDVSHFNLLVNNCANFSQGVLDTYFPHAIHRNIIGDLGMTTPKQVANAIVVYGRKHPELEMSAFVIRQVPGEMPRSHPVDGIAESLVKSKKYLLPLAVLSPELTGGVVVAYLAEGRKKLPKEAVVFNVDDEMTAPGDTVAAPLAGGAVAAPARDTVAAQSALQ